MSWQATAWAAKQKAGGASNKLTLLVLANYADAQWRLLADPGNDSKTTVSKASTRYSDGSKS